MLTHVQMTEHVSMEEYLVAWEAGDAESREDAALLMPRCSNQAWFKEPWKQEAADLAAMRLADADEMGTEVISDGVDAEGNREKDSRGVPTEADIAPEPTHPSVVANLAEGSEDDKDASDNSESSLHDVVAEPLASPILLDEFDDNATDPSPPMVYEVGETVMANFQALSDWAEALIMDIGPNETFTLEYIDGGATEESVPASRIIRMDEANRPRSRIGRAAVDNRDAVAAARLEGSMSRLEAEDEGSLKHSPFAKLPEGGRAYKRTLVAEVNRVKQGERIPRDRLAKVRVGAQQTEHSRRRDATAVRGQHNAPPSAGGQPTSSSPEAGETAGESSATETNGEAEMLYNGKDIALAFKDWERGRWVYL